MLFFMFMVFTTCVAAIQFPPGIKLCHRSDPNFARCLARNIADGFRVFKDGNKEFGIPKINPLYIEKMEIKSDPRRAVSLEQKYTNVYVYGITEVELIYLEIDLDTKCQFITDGKFPILRLEADFELNGKLMVFPIRAKGKCNITQYNSVNRQMMMCEKYTKNNEVYMRVTNYTTNMNPEKTHYDFDNIFPGNEQISAEIIKTINENEMLIFNEVKGSFEEVFSTLHMQMMNKVLSKLPMNKIFLD